MDSGQLTGWIVGGLILVAGFYLLVPWLIYATQRLNGDPKVVLFDERENRPPTSVATYLEETGEALLGLGYEPSPCVALPDLMPNVRTICRVWIHPERRDTALVSAIFGVSGQAVPSHQTFYTEIQSRFDSPDVALIQTNNASAVSAFPDLPNELTFRFPQVESVTELDRLHVRLVERHAPRRPKIVSLRDEVGSDLTAALRRMLVESYGKQEGTGYLIYHKEGNYWRPTIKGAYLMTWSQLWPMSMILKQRLHRRAVALLRELGKDVA